MEQITRRVTIRFYCRFRNGEGQIFANIFLISKQRQYLSLRANFRFETLLFRIEIQSIELFMSEKCMQKLFRKTPQDMSVFAKRNIKGFLLNDVLYCR
jgi:hypothetical protein